MQFGQLSLRGLSSRAALAPLVERWLPIVGALTIITANAMDAATRYMWVDELLTATLAADPSITHMVRALADQVDTSPPLFYVVAWFWGRVFGISALSLRLLAGLFGAAAFMLVWRLLRPYASLAVRSAAVCAALLMPTVVLAQMAEARSYGLLLALAALTLVQLDRIAKRDAKPLSWLGIFAVMVTQASLCLTHVYGLAYSVAALAALVVADFDRGRRQYAPYVAWIAGWIAFAGWVPSLLSQMQVGSPHFPIARPTVADFGRAILLGLTPRSALFVLFMGILAVIVARRSALTMLSAPYETKPAPNHLVLVALAWLLVAAAAWTYSRFATPIFLPRYLVPLSLGYAILFSVGLDRAIAWGHARSAQLVIASSNGPPAGSWLWVVAAIAVVGLCAPLARADNLPRALPPASDSLDFQYDLPIATVSTHTYLPRIFYSPHPDKYVFVLDCPGGYLKLPHLWLPKIPHLLGGRTRRS